MWTDAVGNIEAMRVPRIKRVEIKIARLGKGLDGTKVVLLTDTHYGPIDRVRWSKGVTEAVNKLDADIVCHTGDIADGTAEKRWEMAKPLGDINANWPVPTSLAIMSILATRRAGSTT